MFWQPILELKDAGIIKCHIYSYIHSTCIRTPCVLAIHVYNVHWVSKETDHFFRVMLTKIHLIKINHIWTQIISYSSPREAHLKNQGLVLSKRKKMWWNCRRSFYKNHRNCSLRISTKGRLFRTFNSYSFNFKGGLYNRRTGYCPCRAPCPGGEQFLWFWNWPLVISPYFALYWLNQTFDFWDKIGKEYNS